MYLDYFSLDRHPFRITPDPSLFYHGGQDGRGVILNALIYGINSGEGILKVVGEVGSGKTMLCRMLEEELPDSVEIVYIANPSLSAREILYAIAIELRLEVNSSTERLKVLHLIQDYLLQKHAQGGTVVVFIEEAQSMPLETLEEIRLLSNLETHQHKLMQIVLFGQPELDKILAKKNIRQLKERITHSFSLMPLSSEATSEYIRYRLNAAGCPRTELFSARAENMIARASSGLTRRINILADKSLLAAYADSPSRQPPQNGDKPLVLPRHVKAAIKDSDYKTSFMNPWLYASLGLTVVAIISAVIFFRMMPVASDAPFQSATNSPVPVISAQNNSGNLDSDQQAVQNTDTSSQEVQTEAAVQAAQGLIIREPDAEPASLVDDADEAVIPAQEQELALNDVDVIDEPVMAADTDVELSQVEESDVAQSLSLVEEPDAGAAGNNEALAMEEEIQAPVVIEPPVLAVAAQEPVAEVENPAVEQASVSLAEQSLTDMVQNQSSENTVPDSPVTIVPAGLAELRIQPTAQWLRTLNSKSGYSLVLFSVPSTNPNGLEEYLQFLQLVSLLDETYLCFMPISSPTSGRWQVMHKEFPGVTPARNFINALPVYVQQYNPYVSNLDKIECSYPVDTRN